MAGRLPPLKALRKTTVFAIVVFLCFFLHRFIIFFLNDDENIIDYSASQLSLANSVVCRHIVNGSPFGVDSVFEAGARLHVFSTVANADQYDDVMLEHIWYRGMDTVNVDPCNLLGDVCESMVPPDMVKAGEWSVDLVAGRRLLSSRQFVVNPADR